VPHHRSPASSATGGARICALALALVTAPLAAQSADGGAPDPDDDDICEAGALGQGDELDVAPPDGASGVARDAPVRVRYDSAAQLDELERLLEDDVSAACDALICLFRDDRDQASGEGNDRAPVPGRVDRVDARTLLFIPDARLRPDARHFALVARAGFERLTRGEIEFETGEDDDADPPELALGSELQVDIDELPPDCDAPRGTVRIGLSVPRVHDDGNEESVEVLVYLTRAQGLDGPELRARAPNRDAVPLTFLLSPEEARDSVCIAVRAVDAVGRVAEYDEEVCFHPRPGGFFQSACSVPGSGPADGARGVGAAPGARTHAGLGAILLPLGALLVRRRRRRLQEAA
jgi:hypothetical protein